MPYGLPPGSSTPFDQDAYSYLRRVEDADKQPLEQGIRDAVTRFVIGCKADGIWPALKFACILMGARTLSGALTPLVGAAPTNNNFVSGDYTRGGPIPGLFGNGSTKYINSNRANNADGQDDCHAFAYINTMMPGLYSNNTVPFATGWYTGKDRYISINRNAQTCYISCNNAAYTPSNTVASLRLGGYGVARNGASSWQYRTGVSAVSRTDSSVTPATANIGFFSASATSVSQGFDGSISFISLGSFLNMDSLTARVDAMQNAIVGALS